MTNQENMRGNPNPNSNTPAPAPAPSPSASTSNTPSAKPPSTSAPPAPSLASRIQTSATGLAKSAFQPSSDLANTLASSTSSKPAGPSSLPNTQTSRDLSAKTTPHGAPGSGTGPGSAYAAHSFREHDTSTSTPGGFALPALTEDEFQGNAYAYGYDGIGIADNTAADQLRATTTTNTNQSQFQSQDLQAPSSTWKGKARAHDPNQHQFETVWQRQWHDQQTPQTTDTSATDGAAVVSLLSNITFDPNFEDPTTVPDTEIDIAAAPAPLSAAEKEMLDSFRRGLRLDVEENKEREGNGRLTSASLIPDIDVFLSQGLGAESGIGSGSGTGTREGNAMAMATSSGSGSIPTSIRDAVLRNIPGGSDWVGVQETDIDVFLSQGVGAGSRIGMGIGEGNAMATGSTSTSTSLRDVVLTNLPGAGDWIGVQERYHDEVWGYLQPVLEEARAEIEEKGAEGLGAGEDGPAVRRLKMILMHMKG
ncbi:hypothetical protein N7537_010218 [Penicillium hordei]|uniref:Uncharacterized protein n=1 Tax=Penicillium hordei TaxID=40994 RepID=A0AAD6DU89_9EURO|nr:uncharacterized protein N7537_010218 [Penicillium hordei]KAJ5593314.1 hypothetical protein N7537_010218 [Penicillium hordei]